MRPLLHALVLLLVTALGQVETAAALACEPGATHGAAAPLPGDKSPCPPQQHDGQQSGVPHQGESCAAMVWCSAAAPLPTASRGMLFTPVTIDRHTTAPLPLHSRTDAPANPPPRS